MAIWDTDFSDGSYDKGSLHPFLGLHKVPCLTRNPFNQFTAAKYNGGGCIGNYGGLIPIDIVIRCHARQQHCTY